VWSRRSNSSRLRAAGFDAELDSFDQGGGWDYSASGGTDAALSAAESACEARFVYPVEDLYRQQHGPTDREIATHDAAVRDCLRGLGYPIPKDMSRTDMFERVPSRDYVRCDEQR
jgi:hypothetical protein